MDTLSSDIETYCDLDLKKVGLYKYANHHSFRILMIAYKWQGKMGFVDLARGQAVPQWFIDALSDPTIRKKAFNASFERTCYAAFFKVKLNPNQWVCTMVKAATMGLPMSLEHVAVALNLNIEKDKSGRGLITYFCKPCKPTKTNGGRIRNLPEHAPDKWLNFCRYCVKDVKVEVAVDERLAPFETLEKEHQLWQLDQRINDRGIELNPDLVESAIGLYEVYKEGLLNEAAEITGLDNPNSNAQLKRWLTEELPFENISSLDKDHVNILLKNVDQEHIRRVLQIRQETSKSSIDKYTAMRAAIMEDNRIRGMLQFYGARTGRWAGRIVQPHNLVRNSDNFELDFARRMVVDKDLGLIDLYFGECQLSFILSQLIRTAFIPREGYRLITSDFAQIEARVLAWLAGEDWKLEAFKAGVDIYKVTASQMFKMPVESISKGSTYRQQGKVADLACGYQGSVGAIARMWPKDLTLPGLDERKEIVGRWREANRRIVQMWWAVANAAVECVKTGRPQGVVGCLFYLKGGVLFCELPSGRSLAYPKPTLFSNQWGYDAIEYHGVNQKTRQWESISLYGGLLVENIVQAIARDLLADKMLLLDLRGYEICGHVHDEILIEAPINKVDELTLKVDKIMKMPIPWAKGLPIHAETNNLRYYKKD